MEVLLLFPLIYYFDGCALMVMLSHGDEQLKFGMWLTFVAPPKITILPLISNFMKKNAQKNYTVSEILI